MNNNAEPFQVSPEVVEVCLSATQQWGQSAQLIQSMGECGEFVEVLGRYMSSVGRHFQGRDPNLDAVAEEAADVMILILQVREIVGAERFDATFKRKFAKFSNKVYKSPNHVHNSKSR